MRIKEIQVYDFDELEPSAKEHKTEIKLVAVDTGYGSNWAKKDFVYNIIFGRIKYA